MYRRPPNYTGRTPESVTPGTSGNVGGSGNAGSVGNTGNARMPVNPGNSENLVNHGGSEPTDRGPEPFVIDIARVTVLNNTFRTAIWTGNHLQTTLMSIDPGDDIGLERHLGTDQFIRIEQGQALVKMGATRKNLDFQRRVTDGYAIFIPAGHWHNVINTGNRPLKLYSIYAPPQHPRGTVQKTKSEETSGRRY